MPDKNDPRMPAGKTLAGVGRAAIWLAGSALFGGVALVLWNRRALSTMREAAENPVEPVWERDEHGIY